jgi:hypothetical protein
VPDPAKERLPGSFSETAGAARPMLVRQPSLALPSGLLRFRPIELEEPRQRSGSPAPVALVRQFDVRANAFNNPPSGTLRYIADPRLRRHARHGALDDLVGQRVVRWLASQSRRTGSEALVRRV